MTLCLHNMHSFNYKIWQWINTGALFFHRLVLSIQATFLRTLPAPAKSLAAWPSRLERPWWWKKLSPILHFTLQKLAVCARMGIFLTLQEECWLPPHDTHKQNHVRKLGSFPLESAHLLSFPDSSETNKRKNLLGSICRKSDRFYMDFN